MPQSVLARTMLEADLEAVAVCWRLGRLFIRWSLAVDMRNLQRRLDMYWGHGFHEYLSIKAEGRFLIRTRWFNETKQLTCQAVARVVLLQRLDLATINRVLSYLDTWLPIAGYEGVCVDPLFVAYRVG